MSRWRLPRPVVGAKRIRRGSSAGGSKPLAPNQTPASHHTLLPFTPSSPHNNTTHHRNLSSLSTLRGRGNNGGGRKRSPLTARRSPRTRIMAAAGEGGKEKGPGGACELCGAAARVYCGADEATLCWGCDAQVHGANFLVARHARALLCRGCARPTPWRAAGPRLGPTASLCDRCVRRGPGAAGAGGAGADEEMGGGRGGRDEEDDDGEGEDEEEDGEEEEGEGENQVVPWTEEAAATPPPVASSTSSSSREAAPNGANAAECAKEDVPCSTSQPGLCHYSSPTRHGGRSDEATSSRNGGRFLASRHRKRSPSDFLGPGSAQSGNGTPARNCSNAGIGRNGFT
ncbi:hypothetical protein GQ55_6G053500 [Panicum hallii var. hallii]|uniref:B box-type domain-containing protein n=1 Tax=Panicum hallii var. hallii TaxID=1504633 RepID=A0A2T7D445_9POAL|nr:hypothetical protein GQ55_6G053500 [Panicum hallii var. hallii]